MSSNDVSKPCDIYAFVIHTLINIFIALTNVKPCTVKWPTIYKFEAEFDFIQVSFTSGRPSARIPVSSNQ